MRKISQVIDLIKQKCGVSRDKEVAEILNMSGPALSNHKNRGTIPYEELLTFCCQKDISFDWLLTDGNEIVVKENNDRGDHSEIWMEFGRMQLRLEQLENFIREDEVGIDENEQKNGREISRKAG